MVRRPGRIESDQPTRQRFVDSRSNLWLERVGLAWLLCTVLFLIMLPITLVVGGELPLQSVVAYGLMSGTSLLIRWLWPIAESRCDCTGMLHLIAGMRTGVPLAVFAFLYITKPELAGLPFIALLLAYYYLALIGDVTAFIWRHPHTRTVSVKS